MEIVLPSKAIVKAVIIRYSEIALKGKNRIFFEKKLIKNIKACLKANKTPFKTIQLVRGRIIVYSDEDCTCLKYVFGISSFSHAEVTSIDYAAILSVVEKKLPDLLSKTFRVTVQRVDKNAKFTSMELEQKIGADIVKLTGAKVSLKNYDFELGIEIIAAKAYVFTERIKGLCGLPIGTQEKVAAIIEDNKGLLSALLLMKRGCNVLPVFIENDSIDIDILRNILRRFQNLEKEQVVKNIDDALKLIPALGIEVISVSDTLDNIRQYSNNKLVLRPVVAMADDEINAMLAQYEAW